MVPLWRLCTRGISSRRIGFRRSTVAYGELFYACLTPAVKFNRKAPVFSILRSRATNVVDTRNLEPAARSIKSKRRKTSELKNLIVLAVPEKRRLFGAIVFLLISSSITMAVPFSLGKLIDTIYASDKENMKDNLNRLCVILLGIFVTGALCNFCRIYLMSTAGHKITQSLRKQLYAAILRQEIAVFDKCNTGEFVGRLSGTNKFQQILLYRYLYNLSYGSLISGDTQLVSQALTSNISDGLRSTFMSICGISMMLYASPKLAVVSLTVVPPMAGIAIVWGRYLKKISKDMQNNLAELNTIAEERISNIRTVKAFSKEIQESDHYNSQLDNVLKICYKESLYRGIFFGLTGFSGNVIVLSVLYYGGAMVSDSSLTIGSLSAFLMYAAYVAISLNGLSSFYSDLNKALGANMRLVELIEREPAIPIQGGKILEKQLSGDIEFQNVSFAYPTRGNTWVLKNFTLKIPPCTVTAIVGASGSGKSTIASLLLRLYDPNLGSVLLDNNDLQSLDPVWVRSQIGIVSQEPTLFSGTIRENILYGAMDSEKYDVEEVARHAHVLEFTKNMPDGLDTVVGERGITLSGGQRQRVAIARALIKVNALLK
ncbi:ATP-binding cassette sub-family B member 10, mitochondrial [Melipona quadrifasciata]|uniref:ATP-binding cassette sub-family B member 10, mitochondrial n=1 Tax=Melipona quadrifasciata TaxID=166423 RepID=A0A0N0BJE3_9HYME|nr:ATP-binding cassette sub-family B member 10, mitochondrial [Melipona quadrifasciata]